MVVFRGKDCKLVELCRRRGVDPRTVRCRVERGMMLEEALHRPVRTYPTQVERHRDPMPPSPAHETLSRTLPSQLLEDAWTIMSEMREVLREIPISSRRHSMAIVSCEDWLRRRASGWKSEALSTPAAASR